MAVNRKLGKRDMSGKQVKSAPHTVKQKQAAARLAQAKEQLEDLARFPQENPSPVFRVNRDGSIQYANAACDLLDFKCIMGEFLPERYRKIVAGVLDSGSHLEIEAKTEERIFALDFVPVTGREYVNIYGRDITERQKAEDELRESEEKLRIVSEFTYDWEYWRSPDNAFIYVSPSCERLTGYTSTEFLDDPELYLRIIHPDDHKRVEAHIREEMRHQEEVELEFRIIRHDGQERWVSHACRAVLDADGNFLGRRGSNRDITQRKKAEDALRETQWDLSRAQAVAQTGSWRLDVQRNVLLWSEENHRIFGIPEGTVMTYETFLSCVHPDDREYVDRKWQAALQGEEYDIEHRIIVGDEVRWVREKAGLEFDERGTLKGGFGTTQDITQSKKMEGAIVEEKDRLFALINSIADEVWFADTKGNFTLENEAALREFGIDSPGMVNIEQMAEGLEVYRPDGSRRPVEETPPLRALKGEVIVNAEEAVRTPASGELRYRQVSSSPVRGVDGNIIGSVSVVRDITDRRKAEERIAELLRERSEQLAQTQANFQLLVRNMAEGVIVVDNGGYVKFTNPAAATIFDLPEKRLIGYQFGVPSSVGITEIEAQVGNQIKYLELNTVKIVWDDGPGYLVTLRDVTLRKHAMERIRTLSQRLVEAQEKERRDIGHELHDEVGGALTAVKLALGRARKKLGEKSESELAKVNTLLDETMDLVSNISQNMRPDILNDFGLVEALKWYFERYTARTGIKVRFKTSRLAERYPEVIENTAYRIVQESLTNVARYAGVKRVDISIRCDAEKLYIQVEDRGQGFDAGQIEASGIRGMQDRAFLADGELVVDSSPGEGTCITCELPLTGT